MFARLTTLATDAALKTLGIRRDGHEFGAWRVRFGTGGTTGSEPWVLLHGLGATGATYLPLLRDLRAEADLRLPELSALGGTRGPRLALGVREGAAAVASLVEREFAGRPVTLCGISLGGWTAVRLALERPDLVSRLLLIVPGGYREQDWHRIERMVRVETYRDSAAMWQALFVAPPFPLRFARPLFFLAYTSPTVSATLATVRESDAFGDQELRRLTCPVGLVWGEEDHLFRVEVGQAMAAALPRGRLYRIAGAGHAVQWEKPGEFLASVGAFRREFPLP